MSEELELRLRVEHTSKSGGGVTTGHYIVVPVWHGQPMRIDVAGKVVHGPSLQNIGTSAEALTMGDVSGGGYAIFINRDATNYQQLRFDQAGGNNVTSIIVRPGKVALLRTHPDVAAIFAVSNTAAGLLEYMLVDP